MKRHASLLYEMKRALLAEFGARAIYRRLAKLVRDPELSHVLAEFAREEEDVIKSVRATMQALGAKPRTRSNRRVVLANVLAYTTPIFGPRLSIRVCADAEEQRARWYAHFHEYLVQNGEPALAAECGRLALTKQRHARVLETWVEHPARRT
jgi:rubrerythrin